VVLITHTDGARAHQEEAPQLAGGVGCHRGRRARPTPSFPPPPPPCY